MNRCLVSMSAVALAVAAADFCYAAPPIRNYTTWVDTEGQPISCHDGGITRVGDTFFWYGTSYKGNHSSLTGHNVKSRAHYTRVEYCYVHHSANREFDLVDASDTVPAESHAVLLGNVIVKDPQCKGNKTVIHFGQDGGRQHDGTLHLVFNTIVTAFISPVADLSASRAKASLVGNLVSDGGIRQPNQVLASARNGATLSAVTGAHNWLSGGFDGSGGTGLDPQTNRFQRADAPLFANPSQHDYHLTPAALAAATTPLSSAKIEVPLEPGIQAAGAEAP